MRTFLISGLLVLFLIFIHWFSSGQKPKVFTHEPAQFVEEVRQWLNTISNRQNRQTAIEEINVLELNLRSGYLSANQQDLLYQTANLILRRNLRPYPEFYHYLKSINELIKSGVGNDNLTVWLTATRDLLNDITGVRSFSDLVSQTPDFLQRGILYQGRTFSWKFTGPSFSFTYDSLLRVNIFLTNIFCVTRNDSTVIYNTSGQFLPTRQMWIGRGGRIPWSKVGFKSEMVYTELQDYQIKLNSPQIQADDVKFFHHQHFAEALIGKFYDRTSADAYRPELSNYPRFEADLPQVYLPEIFRDVDFYGKFIMSGNKIIGQRNENKPAEILIKRPSKITGRNTDFMVILSDEFIISPGKITSEAASVTILIEDDSITHQNVQFRYDDRLRQITLLRLRKGLQESPYLSSYHGLEMRFETLVWNMNEDVIRLGSFLVPGNESRALFFSRDYYSDEHFEQLRGIDRKHPLIWLNEYLQFYGSNQFTLGQLATFMKYPQEQVENLIIRLATEGFITYNPGLRMGWINPKVQHYVNSRIKQSDYDQIGFLSRVTEQNNANLNLNDYYLRIDGIRDITLSNARNVFIVPDNFQMKIGRDRNFMFDGKLTAGLFSYQVSGGEFRYNSFSIILPEIDTLRLRVYAFSESEKDEPRLIEIKTPLTGIAGEILIDHPQNKSGNILLPDYPSFTSFSECQIFYDHHPQYGKAYDRTKFYYVVKPFTIKGLDFVPADSLRLYGFLHSGGILQDKFEYPLEVMPDQSLGFVAKSPPEGYLIYDGRGLFHNELSLSDEGLRGKGIISLTNMELRSKRFVFFPDSVKSVETSFSSKPLLNAQACLPVANGEKIDLLWKPRGDTVLLKVTDNPLELFNQQAYLNGKMMITPSKITGSGTLSFFEARVQSGEFQVGCNTVESASASVLINKPEVSEIILEAGQCAFMADFDLSRVGFFLNEENSVVNLPRLKFKASFPVFDWDITNRIIHFHSALDQKSKNLYDFSMEHSEKSAARLVATHPSRESLFFEARNATYFTDRDSLFIKGVEKIQIADVVILPGDGEISAGKDAAIYPLVNASIIADTQNRRHLISNATVKIFSADSYHASGDYTFLNAVEDVYLIHFDNIQPDLNRQTTARGTVTTEQQFMLSPRFAFNGEITMNARDSLLYFRGGYRIIQDCDTAFSRWVMFEQRINPSELILPVADHIQEQGHKKLYAGWFHSAEFNRVYPTFLSRRLYYSDSLLFGIHGVLKTRSNGSELVITPAGNDSVAEEKLSPPFMLWNIDNCTIKARGPFTFGQNLGHVTLNLYGQADYSFSNDSTWFEMMMGVYFHFSDVALNIMAEDLASFNKPQVDVNNPLLREGFQSFAGKTEAERFFNEILLMGQVKKIPEALRRNFIFTNLKMVYHTETRSFISRGPVGVAMINGVPVFKNFDGHIQIARRRTGDELNIYLELEEGHWYFFNYRTNQMLVLSSRSDFNAAVRDVKPEARQVKSSGKGPEFRYNLAPDTQTKNRFLRSMRQSENE